jgi:xanthine dehydrogenase molybdenum-binding subunit
MIQLWPPNWKYIGGFHAHMPSNIVLSTTEYKVVGKRPIRHDGYDKVTGKARFGADIDLPGLLYGEVLRSPHAHARIISIDTSKAEAHPDVRAVITSRDLPDTKDLDIGDRHSSNKVLAGDKVLYKGQAVAAVAASSLHAAKEALFLIEVEYDVLPSVTNVEDALKPGAPQLHDEYEGNVAARSQLSLGDIEKGFKEADLVVEREFRTGMVHQGYIEPHSATAWWTPQDKITLWCSSQGHFQIGESTAKMLDLPASMIKVVPMEIGGGFGGKTTIYLEPLAVLLSRRTGVPVKVTMSRADVMEATGPTSGTYIKLKMGVTNGGRIVSAKGDLMYEAGAFSGSAVGAGAMCMLSPYDIENLQIDGYDVVDNKPKSAAYRAPGAPAAAFAAEEVIDEICRKLSIDPLDFRIMNAAKEGTRRANGVVNPRIGAIETAEAAKAHEHYSAPLGGPNRGRGVASGFWMNGAGAACATANVKYDGTVSLIIGQMDIGGTRPAAAQQFAEVLGIPAESVDPQVGDTDSIGYTSMTGGSGAAFKTGWASYEAAQDVKRQMLARAALLWETTDDAIELVDGVFRHKSDPELSMSFTELAGNLSSTGGPVVGSANLDPAGAGAAFATHLVDLEIDPETGKVTILRYTAVQDAGKAIHPSYVEGQMQGGAVQGIGWALNEEYYMSDDGRMMNFSLLDYRMPIALDLPMIDTVIVEVANPLHPYGVRGVGEVCVVPPLAAIANAIHDAVGVRMTELPMNPPAILRALAEKNGG